MLSHLLYIINSTREKEMDYDQQCLSKNRKCGVERYLNLIIIGFKLLLNRIYQVYMKVDIYSSSIVYVNNIDYKMSCKNSILNISQLLSGLC